MPPNPNWPLTVTQFSTSTPFDGSTQNWVDISSRVRSASTAYGRQYELDVMQTGEATLTVDNKDEALNPTNPSSPYYPNIKPYRQIIDQAMWPPTPVGGAVNLLNAAAGYDPSFESTPVGATPPNLSTISTSPTVQAANPWSGTKSLQWSVTGNSTRQVAGFLIPCVPGQAYVGSVYYRQTAANTGVLFISGGATGSTTTSTGTYVQLSVAFVASQPTHLLYAGSITPTISGTVNIDAVQLEQVGSLNANPSMEGTANWTAHGGTIAASSAWQRDGLYSLLVTPNGVSSQCYPESEQVPVTAGAQYLVSGWVYAPSAVSTFAFEINWFDSSHSYLSSSSTFISLPAGSVTEQDNQYTAPAGAAYATVAPTISGTPPSSLQVYVDKVGLYNTAPSAFSTTGPVIYTPFAGYVERWPVNWNYQGTFGQANITCVDALATLTTQMHAEYRSAVLSLNPAYYWPLSEPSGTTFGEISGNNGAPMRRVDAPFGAWDVFTPGTATNIAGDPSGTGLALDNTTGLGNVQTIVRAGNPNVGQQLSIAPPSAKNYTVAFWAVHGQWPSATGTLFAMGDDAYIYALVQTDTSSPPNITAMVQVQNGDIYDFTTPDIYADGKPHLYVLVAQTSPGEAANLYIDGVSYTGVQDQFSFVSWFNITYVDIGGGLDPGNNTVNSFRDGNLEGAKGGVYAHVAVWNRPLSAAEVAKLWAAGRGNVGETSGARIVRYVSYSSYIGPKSIDTGLSTMGVSTVSEGQSILDACQQVAVSENGVFYAEGGALVFKARSDRYLNVTSKWVFGERADLGEYPYESDIAFDYDPTRIVNDVKVTRSGGITVEVGDQTSQQAYLKHSYSRTIGVQSDNEAVDAANYLLSKGKDPIQRISRLTINPAANPALWPVALGARIGDRVTVERRTSVGYTMSADYFIERIEHSRAPGTWTVSFQMSPAFKTQVWILQDSTYGVLDTSTILSY